MQKNAKSWYKKWWGITLILFISIILIISVASGFYVINLIKQIKSGQLYNLDLSEHNNLNQQTQKLIKGNENNYWLGSADPKITVVEFSDFACLYSKNSFSNIREIGLKYKNSVKIIFRDYPINSNYSTDLALAARCAGDQGLFWLMHDKLFLNQGVSEKNEITDLAYQIGADMNKFTACFNSKKYLSDIQKNLADGRELGIKGTPTWFINGHKIEGDIPYNIFIQIIEGLIQKNNSLNIK